jgi:uncharacterized linocin/CFP29 family protein
VHNLNRHIAPISEAAWRAMDAELETTISTVIAGRKLFDVEGPLGWSTSAFDLGRISALKEPVDGDASMAIRRVQPMIECRVPFTLARRELDAINRGAVDPDLSALVTAARTGAGVEDHVVFHGYPQAEVQGVASGSSSQLDLTEEMTQLPDLVSRGLATLRCNGVDGPFVLALAPRYYEMMWRATYEGGYPVVEHLEKLIDKIVWAPAFEGALLVSRRGGDFKLVIGADFAIGYANHNSDSVALYIEESFTFVVQEGDAVVAFVPGDK